MKKKILIPILTGVAAISAITPIAALTGCSCSSNPSPTPEGKITVTFDVNGGNIIEGQGTSLIDKNTKFKNVNKPVVSKMGNIFSCWCKDREGLTPINENEEISSNLTLYAKYTPSASKHILTFTSKVSDVKYEGFTQVEVIDGVTTFNDVIKPVASKVDYNFKNWVDANNQVIQPSQRFTSDTTIYATFEIIPTRSFETDTWTNVIKYANQGLDVLKEHYKVDSFVGLERELILTYYNYTSVHHVRVIGENQDELYETGSKASLTFELEEIISDKEGMGIYMSFKDFPEYLSDGFLLSLPNEVKQNIKNIKKNIITPSNLKNEEKIQIFLLNCKEIGAGVDETFSLDDFCYEYYKDIESKGANKKRIKRSLDRNPKGYWTREVTSGSGGYVVSLDGSLTIINRDSKMGMAPCFCI